MGTTTGTRVLCTQYLLRVAIDSKIGRLLQTTEPLLMARAEKEDDSTDPRDRDNAQNISRSRTYWKEYTN